VRSEFVDCVGDDAEVLVLACGPCHRHGVNDFRRPPKSSATSTAVQGELGISIDRTGEMPRITVESEGHTRAVLVVQRRVLGPAHPDSLDSQVNLAAIVANQGRVAEALPLLTAAIEGYRATHGPDHPMLVERTAIQSRLRGHS
jgi:hypothetical protein